MIAHTAVAINPVTRILLTETDLPNTKGQLFPGSYAQVRFAVHVQASRISVPVNALLFRAEGPRAVVVGSENKAHLKQMVIRKDNSANVEI